MKKLIIASAIAMTMTTGSAMASQSDVQFFGNVTTATCDLEVEVGGAVNNLIQLGTVTIKGTGTTHQGEEVAFSLKAKDATTCTEAAKLGATVVWSGNLGAEGINNQSGLATDAHVVLKPTNAKKADAITASNTAAEFEKDKLADGYQFTAQLIGGAEAGDFQSAAAYAVTYQ